MMKEIAEDVSLHSFPLDRPATLRQRITFVHNSRKNWNGPTKHSLCSRHFTADCYPPKFRIMESVGMPVNRRVLEKDAVPTIHFRDSDAQERPGSSVSPIVSTPIAILPPTPRPMTCCTPNKQEGPPRRESTTSTKVMEKLECLVKSNQMKPDIPKFSLVLQVQTCSLEAYHSVVNHFAPKMYSFFYPGMQSRLKLAALHFNENSSKEQATTREGDLKYKIAFPKQKGDFTVKKVKTKRTYGYVEILQREVVELATRRTMPQCNDKTVAPPPPLFEQFFHPKKDDAVSQMHTRYGNG